MTGLIIGIFNILACEGMREWSLGEVPFRLLREQPPNELNSLEQMMALIASLWQHAYDFEGLYRFKNKFRPEWRPVSLCSSRSITPLLLANLPYRCSLPDCCCTSRPPWPNSGCSMQLRMRYRKESVTAPP